MAGIEAMVPGNYLYDIAKAVSAVADQYKYGNLRRFSGHGIGKSLHEQPSVYNYIEPKETNIKLQEGLVLALEPMMTLGSSVGVILEDGWSVKTSDNSLSAHWEYSIAITKDGPRILGI